MDRARLARANVGPERDEAAFRLASPPRTLIVPPQHVRHIVGKLAQIDTASGEILPREFSQWLGGAPYFECTAKRRILIGGNGCDYRANDWLAAPLQWGAFADKTFNRLAEANAIQKHHEIDRAAAAGTAAAAVEHLLAEMNGKPIRSAAAGTRTRPGAIEPAAAKHDAARGQHILERNGASALDQFGGNASHGSTPRRSIKPSSAARR